MKRITRALAILACLGTFAALLVDAPVLFIPWILLFLAASSLAAWLWPEGRTVLFVLVTLGLFVYIGALITDISGGTTVSAAVAGVNPEAGEAIYWGKGKCSTCHSLGERGSAVRGPNHANVCAIARDQRVAERQAEGAAGIQTATDYLVESIVDPDAHIVEGFSAAMPKVYLPPISLSAEEMAAVITYMQAQGCEPDAAAIVLPPEVLAAASAQESGGTGFSLVLEGDAEAGRALFFDSSGAAACAKCHIVSGEGADVGPDLSDVAATQTLEYIFESILDPSARIAAGGYEPVLIRLNDGTVISGVINNEDDSTMTIKDKEGVVTTVKKSDIQRVRRYPEEPSIMPSNFGELLSIKQVADLIAFLQEAAGVSPAE